MKCKQDTTEAYSYTRREVDDYRSTVRYPHVTSPPSASTAALCLAPQEICSIELRATTGSACISPSFGTPAAAPCVELPATHSWAPTQQKVGTSNTTRTLVGTSHCALVGYCALAGKYALVGYCALSGATEYLNHPTRGCAPFLQPPDHQQQHSSNSMRPGRLNSILTSMQLH